LKKLNIYYTISIITLAFMMFILFRTLQVTGWFDGGETEPPIKRFSRYIMGEFQVETSALSGRGSMVINVVQAGEGVDEYVILVDSKPGYQVRLSAFEDEQVLVELYHLDSLGTMNRMEGCELLLEADSLGVFAGSTIGNFCGLDPQSLDYLGMALSVNARGGELLIQDHPGDGSDSLKKQQFLFERTK